MAAIVLNIGLTALLGFMLESPGNSPPAVMKPIFTLPASKSPLATAIQPERAVFSRKTVPPFGAGAAPDAAGAEFPLPRAALDGMGAEFHRPGAPMHGAGAALRLPGAPMDGARATPISSAEAPARRGDATIACSGHPGSERGRPGDGEKRRLRRSESAGLRVSDAPGEAFLPFSKSPTLQVFSA